MIFNVISLLSLGCTLTSAFFWEDRGSPFFGIQDQLFGNDGPMFVYHQQNTRFSNDNVKITTEITPPAGGVGPAVAAVPPDTAAEVNQDQMRMYRKAHPPHPHLGFPPGNFLLPPPQPFPLPGPGFFPPPNNNNLLPQNAGEAIYGPIPTQMTTNNDCYPDFLCCGGGNVFRNVYKLLQCCDNLAFDQRYEQCHNGMVAPLRQGMPSLKSADRLAKINCGGLFYLVPAPYGCCNGTFYDKTKFFCSVAEMSTAATLNATTLNSETTPTIKPKVVEEAVSRHSNSHHNYLPLYDSNENDDGGDNEFIVCEIYRYKLSYRALRSWGCCGPKLFNFKTENCTSGEIVQQRHRSAQSIHRIVPSGELMVYCPGGSQHWIDPAKLQKTRCCGPDLCEAPPSYIQATPEAGVVGTRPSAELQK